MKSAIGNLVIFTCFLSLISILGACGKSGSSSSIIPRQAIQNPTANPVATDPGLATEIPELQVETELVESDKVRLSWAPVEDAALYLVTYTRIQEEEPTEESEDSTEEDTVEEESTEDETAEGEESENTEPVTCDLDSKNKSQIITTDAEVDIDVKIKSGYEFQICPVGGKSVKSTKITLDVPEPPESYTSKIATASNGQAIHMTCAPNFKARSTCEPANRYNRCQGGNKMIGGLSGSWCKSKGWGRMINRGTCNLKMTCTKIIEEEQTEEAPTEE